MTSFRHLQRVSPETLADRLETVKELPAAEHEQYSVMKDRLTGEHYLVYAYDHIDAAAGGARETFNHLMPIEADDVLAIVLGEQDYRYPDRWQAAYLRNGPGGMFVWFDAGGLAAEETDERRGMAVQDLLLDFKKRGKFDESAIRELFDKVDREFSPDRDKDE